MHHEGLLPKWFPTSAILPWFKITRPEIKWWLVLTWHYLSGFLVLLRKVLCHFSSFHSDYSNFFNRTCCNQINFIYTNSGILYMRTLLLYVGQSWCSWETNLPTKGLTGQFTFHASPHPSACIAIPALTTSLGSITNT